MDKYIEVGDVASEGRVRSNLADCLRKAERFDEARRELHRAIECIAPFGHAAPPWTSWAILASVEAESGNSAAAARAKQKAIDSYLAYRRDGGENQDDEGRLVSGMIQHLAVGGLAAAKNFLQQIVARTDVPTSYLTFISALQAILNGSRDLSLASAPDIHYGMAAEILILIETLERQGPEPKG